MHKDSHWIMRCMIQRRQLFRRVKTDGITPQLKTLAFYDPGYFVAGQIHNS